MALITFEQLPAAVTQLRDDIALIKQLLIEQANTSKALPTYESSISQTELSKKLGTTPQKIIRLRKRKKIPFFLVGSSPRFILSDVLKALNKS